jgi:uncharacterized membrane protein YgcG
MALVAGQVPVSGYQIPDYSGAAQAAGAAGAAPYQAVSGLIGQAKDYFKQQKEKINSVNTASRIAGLLEAKAPDLVPGISELKMTLDDQELPLSQRIAAAESLFGTMKTGFEVNQLINQNAMMNLRQQKFASSAGGSGGSASSSGRASSNSGASSGGGGGGGFSYLD